jgi:hypothetical protein
MNQLNIPIPPAPILEQAVGYQNSRNARYLALWWEPCGDEAMVSDGLVTFTGLWPGYLAFVQHPTVHPHLVAYNLVSSEYPADFHLVIDLEERRPSFPTVRKQIACLQVNGISNLLTVPHLRRWTSLFPFLRRKLRIG